MQIFYNNMSVMQLHFLLIILFVSFWEMIKFIRVCGLIVSNVRFDAILTSQSGWSRVIEPVTSVTQTYCFTVDSDTCDIPLDFKHMKTWDDEIYQYFMVKRINHYSLNLIERSEPSVDIQVHVMTLSLFCD